MRTAQRLLPVLVILMLAAALEAVGAEGDPLKPPPTPPTIPAEGPPRPPTIPAVGPPRPPGIFVPTPKGDSDTLEEPRTGGAARNVDTVLTLAGDRLAGRIVAIDATGKLRLAGPQFQGEVTVSAAALDLVTFAQRKQESGPGIDEVLLTNGDCLYGQVVALTPDTLVLETDISRPIQISRKVIHSVNFSRGNSLAQSHFDLGHMGPWAPVSGRWAVQDGALTLLPVMAIGGGREGRSIRTSSGENCVAAKLDHDEAVTVEAKVQPSSGASLDCWLAVFAETTSQYGRNSIWARFRRGEFYLMTTRDGGTSVIVNRAIAAAAEGGAGAANEGVVRLAYDPKSGKARLWFNSADLGEYAVPSKPVKGSFILFGSAPCKVAYIRVVRGAAPPSEAGGDAAAREETDSVTFTNRDRVSAASVVFSEKAMAIKTADADLQIPIGNVQSITFRTKGLERPRRQKDDVAVETSAGRVTIRLAALTGEFLTGSSEHLGTLNLARRAVTAIRFNIYREPDKTPPAETGKPGAEPVPPPDIEIRMKMRRAVEEMPVDPGIGAPDDVRETLKRMADKMRTIEPIQVPPVQVEELK